MDVNTKTAVYYFHHLRELIYQFDESVEKFTGEIEVDESYFGGRRKGLRGGGAAGKVPVFGLLNRNGKVSAVNLSPSLRRNGILDCMNHANDCK